MKRLLTFLAVALAAASAAVAQVTARQAFLLAPETVIAGISENTRLDMLDYFEAGMQRPSNDNFGSRSMISAMTDDTLTLDIDDGRVSFSMAVLPAGKDKIIMTITRLTDSATDSAIRFYDTCWNQLDGSRYFAEPTLAQWTGKISRDDRRLLEEALPFILYSASYDPATAALTLDRSLGDYIFVENVDLVDRLVKRSLTFVWNGKKFR